MYINPIGYFTKVNNSPKDSRKPTFKRLNYSRVFTEEYGRRLNSKNSVDIMFRRLLTAVRFPNVVATTFFREKFSQKELDGNLLRLLRPGHDDSYDQILEISKKGYSILETDHGEPLVTIYNNGRYREETFIDRLRKGETANVNIIFSGLDEHEGKTITFGADFYTDVFAARGTYDNPIMRKEMFYLDNGQIKERIEYSPESDMFIEDRFYKDGTPMKRTLFDSIGAVITDTINGITGGG